MISETRSSQPSTASKPLVPWLFLIVSFVGFLDSSYLTAEHYLSAPVPCGLFGGNCEKVLNSQYSMIFGIPTALLGAFYYLVFFIASVFFIQEKKPIFLKYLSIYSCAGLATSIWLVTLQFFIIKAICQYCMLSALTSTVLFITGMVYLIKDRKRP